MTSSLALDALSSNSVDHLALLLPAAVAAVIAGGVVFRWPRLGVVLWLLVICFVPVWLGFKIGVYTYPASIAGYLLLVAMVPGLPRRIGTGDVVLGFVFLALIAPLVIGGATKATIFVALSQWLVAYVLGRLMPLLVGLDWIYRCVAVLFVVVSAGALIELFLHFNPFVLIKSSNPLYGAWGSIQIRGGVPRAEGAFGHSIALGSSIALAAPMVLASSFSLRTRALMIGALIGGVVATFSRGAMLALALAIVISVLFLRDGLSVKVRATIIGLLVVMAAVFIPLVTDTFAAAGSEATLSADYRGSLTTLIPAFSVIGQSSIATISPSGDLVFGQARSIDSQLILTGLQYGWLAVVFGLVAIAGAVVAVLLRRASAPTIAVVAQLPALATVALITQYTMFFWFVAGLAVYSQVERDVPLEGLAGRRGRLRSSDEQFLPSAHSGSRIVPRTGLLRQGGRTTAAAGRARSATGVGQ